jgi:protein required for attachment to host cells
LTAAQSVFPEAADARKIIQIWFCGLCRGSQVSSSGNIGRWTGVQSFEPLKTGDAIMDRITLKHGLWLMVADGEKALFLKNEGDATYPNLQVVREMEQENPPTREQGSDRPGRFSDGPSIHRSAVDDTDWHKVGKVRFADEIADRLYTMAHRGDFREIVLIAPPLVLGELRKKLHQEVSEKVVGEIPKTLTNHAVYDIEKILLAA